MRKFYLLLTLLWGLFFQTRAQDAANFNFTISANFDVSFTNTTVLNGDGPRKAYWSFGDGTKQLSEPLASTKHHYAAAGTYTACLRIYKYSNSSNDSVITGEVCKTFTLHTPDASCGVTFTDAYVATSRLAKLFVALPKHSADKKPEKICWNFGDNQDTCISYNPSLPNDYAIIHKYTQPGEYNVCVKIIYQGGCQASYCRVLKVGEGDLCKVDYSVEAVVGSPLAKKFKATPVHLLQKRPVRICWVFGDGRDTCIQYPNTTNESYSVIHKYSNPGQYNVCVKVLYDGGCETHKCNTITINEPDGCRLNISEVATNSTSLGRHFYATPSPNRIPEKICWDFGDGSDSCIILPNPLTDLSLVIGHRFPGPGVYRVCAKILYAGGCTAHSCLEVVIRPSTNICGGYMTDSLIAPKAVLFKGYNINNPNDHVISWRWTFGDGTGATGREVKHEYANGGKYEVCLYIKTDLGCETKICKSVVVRGEQEAQLKLSPNPVVSVLHAVFQSRLNEQVTINIYNVNGILVRTYTRLAVAGSNSWEFDLSNLPTGIYSVVVHSPNQLANAIFFKR